MNPDVVVVDGHTHIVNRVYWEGIDPWTPQPFGFDFARAYDSGVRVVTKNVPAASVAAEMGDGLVGAMLRRAAVSGHDPTLLWAQVGMLPRAFGIDADDARQLASAPLPRPPRGGLRDLVLQLCSELSSTSATW